MKDKRYIIIDGSNLGHYCSDYTVVDTQDSKGLYYQFVCQCFDLEDAELICNALNKCIEENIEEEISPLESQHQDA